jgi:murein DD-endopeptidase MepM/ murein hydrolase activator NlpD
MARWVADVTVQDGTIMKPGQKFTKTWRILNDGDSAWGDGYVLAFEKHERMGGPDSVPLPNVKPGKQGNVSVDLVAPMQPGRYFSTWRPRDPQGNSFDFEMYADITVQSSTVNTVEKFGIPVSGVYQVGRAYLDAVWYLDGKHKGIDFLSKDANTIGQPILAGGNGVVFRSHRCPKCTLSQPNFIANNLTDAQANAAFSDWDNWSYGFGHLVIVRYDWNNLPENARRVMKANGFENWYTYVYYAHLSEISVAEGDNVVAGQELGKLGNTGNTNWPHLHLEVRVSKSNKNDVAFPSGATTEQRYRRIDPAAMFNI